MAFNGFKALHSMRIAAADLPPTAAMGDYCATWFRRDSEEFRHDSRGLAHAMYAKRDVAARFRWGRGYRRLEIEATLACAISRSMPSHLM